MEVTQKLAEFAAETRYRDIPAAVRERARLAILDTIGTVFAGLGERSVHVVRERAAADFRPGAATVFGTDLRLVAAGAALANGAAVHALDYDSISLTVSGFVASPVLIALLAIAEEERQPISGEQLLEAFILGWEAEAGIARGLGVHHYAKGWHPTATLGTFGAAIAGARLLGLSVPQIRSAIGVAAAEASGLRTMMGNMLNPFHMGKAARNGVVAARLAQSGFLAHESALETPWGFCEVFNGPGHYDLEAITATLGQPYDLVDPGLVVKIYPCCGLIHSGIDAVLDLVEAEDITPEQVRSVEVAVHELVPKTMRFDWPRTGYEAKFSVRFCIATALRERSVRLSHFTDERANDPAMVGLMDRISTVIHPELTSYDSFLEREFTEVTMELTDGRQVKRRVMRIDNRGSKGRPAHLDDIRAKFMDCTSDAPNAHGWAAVFDRLADLENVADIREIIACLR